MAIVMSLFIIIIGFIGFSYLGVRDYPSVDQPIVSVSTNFTGANADVIETQITEPLEQAINGIQGIRSISSSSRDGSSRITVEFDLEVDLETAANDVRDKVSGAIRRLPAEVDPPVVSKADADAQPIFSITLSSESRSLIDLTEFAEVNFKERLQTIPGVSEVRTWGAKRFAIRLWMDPAKLGAYKLTPVDVRDALLRENIELPSGRIEGANTELTVRTMGRFTSVEDFNRMVVFQDGDRVVRFGDLGRAIVEAENMQSILKLNGVPMVNNVIVPQPGANYISIVDDALVRLEELKKRFARRHHCRSGLRQHTIHSRFHFGSATDHLYCLCIGGADYFYFPARLANHADSGHFNTRVLNRRLLYYVCRRFYHQYFDPTGHCTGHWPGSG